MQKRLGDLIGLGILLIIFMVSFLSYDNKKKGLKEQMLVTTGKVIKTQIGKSNYFVIYDFNDQTKSFSAYKSIFGISFRDAGKFLVGKNFPLIFSKEDPKNNALLIFKEDFERYGLVYPDSLKWVCDSLKLKDCR